MKDVLFAVESNIIIAPNTIQLKLVSEKKLEQIHCGQFLHLEVPAAGLLLRRPFCIAMFDDFSVTIIIAIIGKGTIELAKVRAGDKLHAILPIGNGYKLKREHKTVALIGGGVGVAPLLSVPKCYPGVRFYSILGFSNKEHVILKNEFELVSGVKICTDDGSCGFCGYPSDYLDKDIKIIKPDVILTCGPTPLLKAVARVSLKHNIPAFMSGESRMGCGVGACLVCTCAVKQSDESMKNVRACVDGPVFDLKDIIL